MRQLADCFGVTLPTSTGESLYTFFFTGSILGYLTIIPHMQTLTGPNAVGIGKFTIGIACSFYISAICILQFCGNQRNLDILRIRSFFRLNHLISDSLSTRLSSHRCTVFANDISAAYGSVQVALRCINSALNNNLCIHQIGFGTSINSAGCVGRSNKGLI